MDRKFGIAIHGGAGTLVKGMMTPDKEADYKKALQNAVNKGFEILQGKGSAVSAVQAAVMVLEDCPLFNAGKGSVFTAEGTHEMDAAIMDGSTLNAGAVSLVTGIRNPISLARDVMEKSGHVFLAGEGALQFAKKMTYKLEDPSYFYDEFRYNQWQGIRNSDTFQLDHSSQKDPKFGTVGAVACDAAGNVAAATSTGGMTNKQYGRVGDSPMIGSGTYANNSTCAISCTGSGEFFIRGVIAYDVSCLVEHKGMSLEEAARLVVHHRLLKLGGDGGLIAIDSNATITMPFNTEGMYRAYKTSTNQKGVSIYGD